MTHGRPPASGLAWLIGIGLAITLGRRRRG
jgi:hypothetical protein